MWEVEFPPDPEQPDLPHEENAVLAEARIRKFFQAVSISRLHSRVDFSAPDSGLLPDLVPRFPFVRSTQWSTCPPAKIRVLDDHSYITLGHFPYHVTHHLECQMVGCLVMLYNSRCVMALLLVLGVDFMRAKNKRMRLYFADLPALRLSVDPRYCPAQDGVVPVSATMICALATASSSHDRVNGRSFHEHMRLGTLRHSLACTMVLEGKIPPNSEDVRDLKDDMAWKNILCFLQKVSQSCQVSAWERPMIGVVGGCPFGVTSDGILISEFKCSTDSDSEFIVELKSGARPSGKRALQQWVDGGCDGSIPDNLFASHVLQVNLQLHARAQELAVCGLRAPKRAVLVYATPSSTMAEEYWLPEWYVPPHCSGDDRGWIVYVCVLLMPCAHVLKVYFFRNSTNIHCAPSVRTRV
jgi:hypothetical protein